MRRSPGVRVRSLPKDDTKVTRAEPHVTRRQRGGKKLLKRRRDGAERRGTHARHANERGAEEGNFQTFATRVWRCEDLFTRGALFSNARRSRVRCLSAPLTSSFKRELSQTLDTWLAGWLTSRASNRLHASISYFYFIFLIRYSALCAFQAIGEDICKTGRAEKKKKKGEQVRDGRCENRWGKKKGLCK